MHGRGCSAEENELDLTYDMVYEYLPDGLSAKRTASALAIHRPQRTPIINNTIKTVMKFQGKTLACKLTTPELQKRRNTVIRELKELVHGKKELSGGLEFTFRGQDEVLDKLLDFVKTERMCCDFLSFRLSIADDTATLEITGPEGTREFLESEVGF